jgi:hypothetical protein
LEHQRIIGFFMVLGGMALIIITFLAALPNQMASVKTDLVIILYIYVSQLNLFLPYINIIYQILLLDAIKLFDLIETAPIFIYAGIALGVIGAVLMYFEGITLEEVDETELKNENRKNLKTHVFKE